MSNPIVIVITGATASGKTDFMFEVNSQTNSYLINADSIQVYKELSIGCAKPDMNMIDAHNLKLINICSVRDNFNVAQFCHQCLEHCQIAWKLGKIPIICGGSMMYLNAFMNGISDLPASKPDIIALLNQRLQIEGLSGLYQQLLSVDKSAAESINPNDTQRILRALAVYQQTGSTISELQKQNLQNENKFDFRLFSLNFDRKALHLKIEKRLIKMFADGVIDEVKQLIDNHEGYLAPSVVNAIGYRQILHGLKHNDKTTAMFEKSLYATRQYAKRQLTWLRRFENNIMLNIDNIEGYQKSIVNVCQELERARF